MQRKHQFKLHWYIFDRKYAYLAAWGYSHKLILVRKYVKKLSTPDASLASVMDYASNDGHELKKFIAPKRSSLSYGQNGLVTFCPMRSALSLCIQNLKVYIWNTSRKWIEGMKNRVITAIFAGYFQKKYHTSDWSSPRVPLLQNLHQR